MYILLDTVLATDVNKYSVTIAGCQQRWRTNWIHLYLFLGVDCGVFLDYQSWHSSSPWFGQSANHGICRPSYLADVSGYHLQWPVLTM